MGCFVAGCSADLPSSTEAGSAKTGDKPAVVPAATNENLAPAKNIFQPSAIDPALVRQSMQARSEYEEMNRKIIARMTKLYEENPEIKDLQAKMRDLQKKIDALLAEDEELAKLKKKFQTIAPEIPTMPRKPAAPVSAGGKK
jgi:septal ring factor EnvC (AmiA/AmiB activator)